MEVGGLLECVLREGRRGRGGTADNYQTWAAEGRKQGVGVEEGAEDKLRAPFLLLRIAYSAEKWTSFEILE